MFGVVPSSDTAVGVSRATNDTFSNRWEPVTAKPVRAGCCWLEEGGGGGGGGVGDTQVPRKDML